MPLPTASAMPRMQKTGLAAVVFLSSSCWFALRRYLFAKNRSPY